MIPQAPLYNPIAAAQAMAQQQAQASMELGGQGASVTPNGPPATAAANGSGGGLLGSISKLFGNGGGGDPSSMMKLLAMLG